MSGLLLKIVGRFLGVSIALAAGFTLVVVILVFAQGTGILHDHTFVTTIEVCAFFIPIASALIAIPNAIREHREKRDGS